MGLKLRDVPAAHGPLWLRQGLECFARRPLGFTVLFVAYVAAATLIGLLPVVGSTLSMAALPLLSLVFMRATHDSLQGRAVHIGPLLAIWRAPAATLRATLALCLAFGVIVTVAIALLVAAGGDELVTALAPLEKSDPTPQELMAVVTHPAVSMLVNAVMLVMAVISVPYWHALALVHWGGQSAGQALFSSTFALWRTRGAFALYCLSWFGCALVVTLVASLAAMLLALVVGPGTLPIALAMMIGISLSAAFYVSLWFMFADTFDVPTPLASGADDPPSSSLA